MHTLAEKLRSAGVEHKRTREIREVIEATRARAESLRRSFIGKGFAPSLAERQRRAAARVMSKGLKPAAPTFPAGIHMDNTKPWENLANAVIAAWR